MTGQAGQVGEPGEQGPGRDRASQVAASLAQVRARISAACQAAGRPADDVTLIAITKTFPASDIRVLSSLGVRDVGENRDQEAAPKAAECADLRDRLTWHFVGQLQTNKVSSVVQYADVIHSVDRARLVTALGTAARKAGRTLTCLVQVSLDGDVRAVAAPPRPTSPPWRTRWPGRKAWNWEASWLWRRRAPTRSPRSGGSPISPPSSARRTRGRQ